MCKWVSEDVQNLQADNFGGHLTFIKCCFFYYFYGLYKSKCLKIQFRWKFKKKRKKRKNYCICLLKRERFAFASSVPFKVIKMV